MRLLRVFGWSRACQVRTNVTRTRRGPASPALDPPRSVVCTLHSLLSTRIMHDGTRSVYSVSPPGICSHRGLSLRQAWYNALNDAQTSFRLLLTSTSSPDWKRVPLPRENASLTSKGKGRSSLPELSDVIVHRRSAKSEDTVYRVVLDVPTVDDTIPFDVWKSILATPELRQEWDPAVDGAVLLEMLDPTTRISKTNFTLGWPAKCVRRPSNAPFGAHISDKIQ